MDIKFIIFYLVVMILIYYCDSNEKLEKIHNKVCDVLWISIGAILYGVFILFRNLHYILIGGLFLFFGFIVYIHYFPRDTHSRASSISQSGSGLCQNYYDRAIDGSLCGKRASNPNKYAQSYSSTNANISPKQVKTTEISAASTQIYSQNSVQSSNNQSFNIDDYLKKDYSFNVDDYLNKEKPVDQTQIAEPTDIKIGFGCSLTDGRSVYVSKLPSANVYEYIIFGKQGNVELNFTNSVSQIQRNSLSHKNGITLVMQNKTYQYRISKQGQKTTLFVYNGDKGVSTHYCEGQAFWDQANLPYIGTNAGSKSHKQFCKQILNEGLYLTKMAKRCPYELAGVPVSVEDTAILFDAEGCGYLLQQSDQTLQAMMSVMSDRLNTSIDNKMRKLGANFCAKEADYARKMAERYVELFNSPNF